MKLIFARGTLSFISLWLAGCVGTPDATETSSSLAVSSGAIVSSSSDAVNGNSSSLIVSSPPSSTPITISSSSDSSNSAIISSSSEAGSSNSSSVMSTSPVSSDNSTSSVSSVAANSVTLRGTITFDSVSPVRVNNQVRLNYDAAQAKPARAVTVELLNEVNTVMATTTTDLSGEFIFQVDANTNVKVRAKVELVDERFNISIRDNTNNNALYVLDGSLANTGNSPTQIRNLHAQLGWDENSLQYTGERQSGPFAILDRIYDSVTIVIDADPSFVLPALNIFWSVNNVPVSGNLGIGFIGTSFFNSGQRAIYLLGGEDNDTDEFDHSVIQHEFGHFIEHNISRSESTGGGHSLTQSLDMRLAFGEGWGNAFASMSSGQSVYLDTIGAGQQRGFGTDLESTATNGGFYTEGVVQTLLWDFFDGGNEAGDAVNVGSSLILRALSHADYINFDGFTSIFPFVDILKELAPQDAAGIDALLRARNIFGTGKYGAEETRDAGYPFILPVYHRVSPGDTVEVCSDNSNQEYNGVEVNRFVLLDVPAQGNYTISATRSRGAQTSNPNLNLFLRGVSQGSRQTTAANSEVWTRNLNLDVYALIVSDGFNVDGNDGTGGFVCFNVSLN